MRWFKMDVTLPTDVKILTLPTDSHRWLWVCILSGAGYERKGGLLGPSYDAKYFAKVTDFSEGEIAEALATLAQLKEPLIEIKAEGIQVLNWEKRQSQAEYMAGWRGQKNEDLQCKSKRLTKLPEDKIRIDKNREDNTTTISEFWASLSNLQQPRKITAEDKKAIEFRLKAGAPIDEIKAVLTWYNAALGEPRSFWGGHNDSGRPIKFNIRRVMKGKMADRCTYAYDHFLEASAKFRSANAKEPEPSNNPEVGWEPREEPKRDPEAASLWAEIIRDVKDRDTWLRPCVATGLTEKVLTIAAPNNLYGEFIKENYLAELEKLAGRKVEVTW